MRRFAIVCLTLSTTFMLALAGLVLLGLPATEPTLNDQFREINELKADFARLGMDLNRISRGAGRTMGATSETPETTAPPEEEPQPAAEETQEEEVEGTTEG